MESSVPALPSVLLKDGELKDVEAKPVIIGGMVLDIHATPRTTTLQRSASNWFCPFLHLFFFLCGNRVILGAPTYQQATETSSKGEKMVEEEKWMGSEGKGNGGGGGEREMSGGGEGEVTVARERKWEGSVMGGMGQGSGCR
ncbi:hypothetical protein LOK49_LG05G01925 [Camellia lanceoleosa]|uniref:Uncharacterized protein n=1 Tax=Camellia lanceoleosa TaxID=1840588 RepID=A0ACC0HUP6_9ERIC|nr:hypothetical protein LOK49_LG05G01925 [Camellia lanceoleosa]